MATILKTRNVLTRKSHICVACLRKFLPFTKMQYQVCIYEGNFCTTYLCETCQEIIEFSNDCEWEEGEVDNRLEPNQTPEELLIYLKKTKR